MLGLPENAKEMRPFCRGREVADEVLEAMRTVENIGTASKKKTRLEGKNTQAKQQRIKDLTTETKQRMPTSYSRLATRSSNNGRAVRVLQATTW